MQPGSHGWEIGDPCIKEYVLTKLQEGTDSPGKCAVYTEASSTPCEPLSCVLLKLGSIDQEDPGSLRFHDHLFIQTIRSLIHNPEEPQVSGWN